MPTPPERSVVYDFGPGTEQAGAAPAAAAPGAPLLLADVESPGLPEGSRAMWYRLAYDDAQQLRSYQRARWSQTPAQLVQQAVAGAVGATRPVLGMGAGRAATRTGTDAPPILRLELAEFSQVFSAPDKSEGVLRVRATLSKTTPLGEQLLSQRVFSVHPSAPTADAAGGSAALALAAQQVAQELADWVAQATR